MTFLAAIAAKILEWLLEKGGKQLYDYVTEMVRRNKENANNKLEKERKLTELENAKTPEERKKANENILNS